MPARFSSFPGVRVGFFWLRFFNGIRLWRCRRSEFCLGLRRVLQLRFELERQLVYLTGKLERRIVAILDHRDARAAVLADIESFIFRESDRRAVFDGLPVRILAVYGEHARAALAEARTIRLEVEDDGVLAGAQLRPRPDRALEVEKVVEEHGFARPNVRHTLAQEQPVAAEAAAFRDNHAFPAALGNLDLGGDGVGL